MNPKDRLLLPLLLPVVCLLAAGLVGGSIAFINTALGGWGAVGFALSLTIAIPTAAALIDRRMGD